MFHIMEFNGQWEVVCEYGFRKKDRRLALCTRKEDAEIIARALAYALEKGEIE